MRTVITNGCFDVFHAGHASFLSAARRTGDRLIVLLNDDYSVLTLKGDGRPIVPFDQRKYVLQSLRSVDGVLTWDGTPEQFRLIVETLRPAKYAKGADYSLDSLDAAERSVLEDNGVTIAFVRLWPYLSSTNIIEKIKGEKNVCGEPYGSEMQREILGSRAASG